MLALTAWIYQNIKLLDISQIAKFAMRREDLLRALLDVSVENI